MAWLFGGFLAGICIGIWLKTEYDDWREMQFIRNMPLPKGVGLKYDDVKEVIENLRPPPGAGTAMQPPPPIRIEVAEFHPAAGAYCHICGAKRGEPCDAGLHG